MTCFVELTDKQEDLNILVDLSKVLVVTHLRDGTTKLETDTSEIEVHEGYKVIKKIMEDSGLIGGEV